MGVAGPAARGDAQWRCPACLSAVSIPEGAVPTHETICPVCGLRFAAGSALSGSAYNPQSASAIEAMPSTERPGQLGFWEFLLLAAAAFGAYFALTLFPHSLRGPAFLIYYGAVWIGLFALTWTMRLVWRDSWLINFAAIAVFEALGYHRYQSASAAGMHKFGYLFVMMVLGGLAFLFGRKRGPADPDDESGSSSSGYYFMGNCSSWTSGAGSCSSGSSCSSGGSCGGGGGCGGGGCGGCGGS